IAAAKLGYSPIDAFDFDPEAVRVANANARKNHVIHKARIIQGDITKVPLRPERCYDVVCANLISNLLIAEKRRIVARLQPDGILVLAGILRTEFVEVQKEFELLGLRFISGKGKKEWYSGAFSRRPDAFE